MLFQGSVVGELLFFFSTGIAGISLAFLFLAGLFALAGRPDYSWAPAKRILVGSTVVVLIIWVLCVFFLVLVTALKGLGVI
jgi:hypothetical protein